MADHFKSAPINEVPSYQKRISATNQSEPPRKKIKQLLTEETPSSSENESSGGVPLHFTPLSSDITINEEFARRFEHNKRREELLKLEEKYGKKSKSNKPEAGISDPDDGTDTSSDSEEEDDEGILASGDLDKQYQATLRALQTKDPRVYDKSATFYTQPDGDDGYEHNIARVSAKPMHLSDYHRKNLLEGVTNMDESETLPSYMQEQDDMKATIVQEIHTTANEDKQDGSDSENNDDFLIQKSLENVSPDRNAATAAPTVIPDVHRAEEDPEKFLSDFMSSRAWIPHAGSRFQPFESDDEEEEKRADQFEEAYNLRFEDPNASNEKLVSHARDTAARYSVRREALTGRKRARELDRSRREAERRKREEEKARLRKLKIADAEEKIKKIKDAAGLRQESLDIDHWSQFLDEGWDDTRWEQEMRKSFGENYYADRDTEDHDKKTAEGKAKIKKPKWTDDINIQDLVPEFNEHGLEQFQYDSAKTESDGEMDTDFRSRNERPLDEKSSTQSPSSKKKSLEQTGSKKQSRKERRQIEELVDQSLSAESKLAGMGKKHSGVFRYRETSPVGYGLTAQDILMASDSQLNQYAGLKKLAAFRDSMKKARDRKRLGKKARLRQWRKETFGNEFPVPQKTLGEIITSHGAGGNEQVLEKPGNIIDGTRRKKKLKSSPHVAQS